MLPRWIERDEYLRPSPLMRWVLLKNRNLWYRALTHTDRTGFIPVIAWALRGHRQASYLWLRSGIRRDDAFSLRVLKRLDAAYASGDPKLYDEVEADIVGLIKQAKGWDA